MNEIVNVNASKLKAYGEDRFAPNPVYQSDGMKVVLAYFKPGQFIPVHSPGVELVLYIIAGEAEVVTGDERVQAQKDDLLVFPKGVKRGVKALTELTILHVVSPPPSADDHNEVHAKLAEGSFE
jgi:quercetin dioxygenase-like cupin family protein